MQTKRGWVGLVWSVLIGLLMACNDTALTLTPAMISPPVVTSAALQPTIEQAQVDLYVDTVRAEQERRAAEATLAALYGLQTATAIAVQATATAEAWAWQTTVEAQQAQATATAWQTTVEAQQAQATATAWYQQQQAYATAQAAQATATVSAIVFAEQATATAEARAVAATATVQALQAVGTLQAVRVEQEQLSLVRAEQVNSVKAWAPLVFTGLMAVVLLVGVWRLLGVAEKRARVVKFGPQEREIIMLNGGVALPGRSWGPVLEYTQAALPSPEEQSAVTERDQSIMLVRAGRPSGKTVSESQPERRAPGLGQVREFRSIRHAKAAGVLPAPIADAIEAEWRVIGGHAG